jgi:hypothetical protein
MHPLIQGPGSATGGTYIFSIFFFSWNTHVVFYAPHVKLVNVSLHYITKYLTLYRANLQTYVTGNTLLN